MLSLALPFIVALFPQLGWRAGTPSPVLDGNPEYVELYWKSWENYYETVVEDIRPQILPMRFSAPGGQISFDKTIAHGFFAKWGYKAAPLEQTLRFLAGRMDSRGAAPFQISAEDASGTGEALGPPLLSLLVGQLYSLSANKDFVREMYAACARRNLYFSGAFLETLDNGPKKQPSKRWRVPRNMSCVPQSPESNAIGDTAEALSLMLVDTDTLSKLGRIAMIPNGETAFDKIAAQREAALEKIWDAKVSWWRGADKDKEAFESVTLVPAWSLITGRLQDRSGAIAKSLGNPQMFGRWLQFPSYAASDDGFAANSGVLPLHQYLTVKAMMKSGQRYAAGMSVENMLSAYWRASGGNNTLFAEYGPDTRTPAPFAAANSLDAGAVTIACLIEGLIGIDVDADAAKVTWDVWRKDRHGIDGLRFGTNNVSLIASERETRFALPEIKVSCEAPFTLRVLIGGKSFEKQFSAGEHNWKPG